MALKGPYSRTVAVSPLPQSGDPRRNQILAATAFGILVDGYDLTAFDGRNRRFDLGNPASFLLDECIHRRFNSRMSRVSAEISNVRAVIKAITIMRAFLCSRSYPLHAVWTLWRLRPAYHDSSKGPLTTRRRTPVYAPV